MKLKLDNNVYFMILIWIDGLCDNIQFPPPLCMLYGISGQNWKRIEGSTVHHPVEDVFVQQKQPKHGY